jgi:hypothetical protein
MEGSSRRKGAMIMKKIILLFLFTTIVLVGCNETKKKSSVKAPFELTQEEQKIYSELQIDLSEQHMKNLPPISVAKIYVQSQFDENYDVTYALYTDRNDHIRWTKEEDDLIPESDRGTREQLLKTYTNMDKGVFIETSDYEGYIEYQSNKEGNSKSGFQMVKDEDGIWNVGYMPIQ